MAVTALSRRPDSLSPAVAAHFAPDDPVLREARTRAQSLNLSYAGNLTPLEAFGLFERDAALLLDVRTAEERKFVGYVPGSLHLPWLIGTAMQTNPRFTRELEGKVSKDAVILLLCRSGTRSAAAAAAATRVGFSSAYSIDEGFEGDLDSNQQRGSRNGWRFHRLRWAQD